MSTKVADNLYCMADADLVTQSITLGGGFNSVQFEVWVVNSRGNLGANGVAPVLQGSNDGVNWQPLSSGTTTTVSPSYKAFDYGAVISYRQVRLKFTADNVDALVDATITPYQRS